MNEFNRIAKIFRPLTAGVPEALGLTDDAAIVTPVVDEQWVVTTDAISEGIHYLSDTAPDMIARKLLRTNLSDLAAKGANPRFYTLNIMLPEQIDDRWLQRFANGLKKDQQQYGIRLIGGDSIAVKGGYASFSVTAWGAVPDSQAILRNGANAGDVIGVSGVLGEAALGLKLAYGWNDGRMTEKDRNYYLQRYHLPEPRMELGQRLVGIATSCMDISDGLVQDAGHLATASKVKLKINSAAIPVTPYLELKDSLTHGDDYELLFTLPEAQWEKACQLAGKVNVAISRIGHVVAGKGVLVLDGHGQTLEFSSRGWQHSDK